MFKKISPLKYILLIAGFLLLATACGSDSEVDTSTSPDSSTTNVTSGGNNGGGTGGGGGGGDGSGDGSGGGGINSNSGGGITRVALQRVDSCDTLLNYFKTEALELVGPYGLDGGDFGFPVFARSGVRAEAEVQEFAFADSDASAPLAASPESGGGAGTDFSTTNVQVEGVDEPDIVKTDGRRIVGITTGELWIIDTTVNPAEKIGSFIVGNDYERFELFLYNDKVFVMGTKYQYQNFGYSEAIWGDRFPSIAPRSTVYTNILEIDISSDEPQVLNEMILEGTYTTAREVGGTVNIVLESTLSNQLPFVRPAASSPEAETLAEETNRRTIQESELSDWLPTYYLISAEEGERRDGPIAPCEDVLIPSEFAGLDLLSVLTLDMEQGLNENQVTSITTSGGTVYSSGDNLYVAHQVYQPFFFDEPEILEELELLEEDSTEDSTVDESPAQDEIWFHKFETPIDGRATYVASGSVNGRILNQFSMHETANEHFWIVTTTNTRGDFRATESFVTSFRQSGDELVEVGSVGNLGKNEEVQSVRFVEERAYVVTFRRIDPFYVVDLSDPGDPRVEGELKIPGFSSYLHPLGNDQVLGVGRSATEEGRDTGAKLSLFDASDPTNPLEIEVLELGSGFTNIQWDHRAFLYWDPADRLVMPFRDYSNDFYGAIVIHLDPDSDDALREVGRFQHSTTITTYTNAQGDVLPCPTEPTETVTPLPQFDGTDSPPTTNTADDEPEDNAGETSTFSRSEDDFQKDVQCGYTQREIIERSLVISDALWTLSENFLEARNIESLELANSARTTDDISITGY